MAKKPQHKWSRVGRAVLWILPAVAAILLSGCFDLGDEPGTGDDPSEDGGDGNDTVERRVIAPPGFKAKNVSRTVEYIGIYNILNLEYTDRIEVEASVNLTLTFDNQDSNPLTVHDWYLEELDVGTDRIPGDETTSLMFFVALPPGEYVYYCTVDGHRENGMEGTLVVTEYTGPP